MSSVGYAALLCYDVGSSVLFCFNIALKSLVHFSIDYGGRNISMKIGHGFKSSFTHFFPSKT